MPTHTQINMLNRDRWKVLVSERLSRPKIHMLVTSVTVCTTRVLYKSASRGGYVRHRSENCEPQRINCHAELLYFKSNDTTSSVQLWNLQKTAETNCQASYCAHRNHLTPVLWFWMLFPHQVKVRSKKQHIHELFRKIISWWELGCLR